MTKQPQVESLTRFQAQVKLGLFAPFDVTLGVISLMSWVTFGFYWLFKQPSTVSLIAFALINIAVMLLLLVVLAYRVLVFVLDLGAAINLMPEAAARIVAGYYEGRSK